MIPSIQTTHNGITYRSKLEACWAVFFDEMSIRYDYEPDAYSLPCGNYTPDFWLPDLDLQAGIWVEIKGQTPTSTEERKCIQLADCFDRIVVLIVGPPMRHVRAMFDEVNAMVFKFEERTRKIPSCLEVITPDTQRNIFHHAGVLAHHAVRWSPDSNWLRE